MTRSWPKPKPIGSRLLARIQKDADTGCWNWLGCISAEGYGRMGAGNGHTADYTHRLSYREFVGPIPDGLHIDHLCRNRRCCNPDHLEAVTQRENLVRGEGPAARATATCCARGHAFDEANTYRKPNGTRLCRACERIRAAKRRASKHDDYDGAEDANDNRCGSAGSLEDAKLEIDMILEDWSDEA